MRIVMTMRRGKHECGGREEEMNEPISVRRAKLTREISSPPIDFACAMTMMFFQTLPQTIISKIVTLQFEDIPS